MTGDASVRIDYDKVAKDKCLDGYKGYTTNSSLPDDRVIEEYGYLFMIERTFRLCKTDLDIRPMYHRLFNRIEAHVCICFVAYTIMLELERILKTAGTRITLDRARFLAEKIYQIDYINPYDNKRKSVLLHTKEEPEVTELLDIILKWVSHCGKQEIQGGRRVVEYLRRQVDNNIRFVRKALQSSLKDYLPVILLTFISIK